MLINRQNNHMYIYSVYIYIYMKYNIYSMYVYIYICTHTHIHSHIYTYDSIINLHDQHLLPGATARVAWSSWWQTSSWTPSARRPCSGCSSSSPRWRPRRREGRWCRSGRRSGSSSMRSERNGKTKKVTRVTKGFCQLVEIHFASWNYRNRWLVEMVFPGPMFCWCAAMKHSGLSKNAVDLKFNSWLSFSHSKSLIFPLTIAIKLGKKTTNSGQTKISYQVGYRTYYFPNIYIYIITINKHYISILLAIYPPIFWVG